MKDMFMLSTHPKFEHFLRNNHAFVSEARYQISWKKYE